MNIMNHAQVNMLLREVFVEEDLIPAYTIDTLEKQESLQKETKKQVLQYEQVKELMEQFGGKPECVYFNKKGQSSCLYIDFPFCLDIAVLDEDFLKMIRFQNAIKKKDTFQQLIDEGDYSHYFLILPSMYRLIAYTKLLPTIPGEKKYNLFMNMYRHADYGLSRYVSQTLQDVLPFQTKEDRQEMLEALQDLPDDKPITIYRGVGSVHTPLEQAYSWTLNVGVAVFFATRFSMESTIYEATCYKKDIIDYFPNRSEEEIFIAPKDVKDVKVLSMVDTETEIKNLNNAGFIDGMHEAMDYLPADMFEDPYGIHGILHAKRVLLHCLSLGLELELEDYQIEILKYCANYHDIGREHDHEDETHGKNSVEILEETYDCYRLEEDRDYEFAHFIMEYHCIDDMIAIQAIENSSFSEEDKEELLYLYKIFKDADALDRFRFDFDFDIRYLRIEESKKRLVFAQQLVSNVR